MIITLAQVKTLLQISGSTYDALISALIPEAEAKYLQIRGIPFTRIQGDITASDNTVSNIALYPTSNYKSYDAVNHSEYVERMEYLYSAAQSVDSYVTDIDIDNNTIELYDASSTTATDVLFTVYPQGAKMAAAKIIGYLMNKNSQNGMMSESIGSYSYSKGADSNAYGIPNDIVQSIKRFINC